MIGVKSPASGRLGVRRNFNPSAASPIVPVTKIRSPALAPLRMHHAAVRHSVPNAAIETVTGPGVRSVSPPNSGQPKRSASSPSPRAKAASQSSPVFSGMREREQEAGRLRPLGGKIGEVDAQRFARDRVGRIVGEEMHPADDRHRW